MFASVDGFRKGWIIAKGERWPSDTPIQFLAVPTFSRVLAEIADCSAVVVDMPIGMPHGSDMRICDQMTRDAFPELARSIFRTPPRLSLNAKTPSEFRNLVKEQTSKNADFAAWSI